ncbi:MULTISPECIES: GNAT family N-acetyltransferase [Kitasatospora]|uniref:Putative acetyltransferase n=1 Tax=Kitasatospora setae (strain ATCC 33774 / DSM 43861 / JCM 3304 / KCC A-0304 / NBRC 14216 / KM-6054) TaxID=452652 RepID=E4N057_KITSK|nr:MULTISPECIES: GNAT family N-acetyltransferase [Kitasatospora]BAJ31385.1 putative acetyltransferase [Kitasatospora setae KM-6054]
MIEDSLRTALEFRRAFARGQAAEVVEVPGGFGVLCGEFEYSHEHNQLVLDAPPSGVDVAGLAEEVLGHLEHRRISVFDDASGLALVPGLTAAGYRHETELVMVHRGPVPPGGGAGPVGLDELAPALERQWRCWLPWASDDSIAQLVNRRTARAAGAELVLTLAARDGDGAFGSWADLYQDAAGTAQIEDLATAEEHQRRGLADAVLSSALRLAADRAPAGLRFLVADAEDWPRQWYARRGFTAVGRTHGFVRQ